MLGIIASRSVAASSSPTRSGSDASAPNEAICAIWVSSSCASAGGCPAATDVCMACSIAS
ncbi:hypothetical protein BJF78_25180 [Pseudonocardia sp. CNS-139]|nr:hypothetical protein BJF78_25180 [Pseudonocardia sp. CNS-139]